MSEHISRRSFLQIAGVSALSVGLAACGGGGGGGKGIMRPPVGTVLTYGDSVTGIMLKEIASGSYTFSFVGTAESGSSYKYYETTDGSKMFMDSDLNDFIEFIVAVETSSGSHFSCNRYEISRSGSSAIRYTLGESGVADSYKINYYGEIGWLLSGIDGQSAITGETKVGSTSYYSETFKDKAQSTTPISYVLCYNDNNEVKYILYCENEEVKSTVEITKLSQTCNETKLNLDLSRYNITDYIEEDE